jgi:hypothetical protein
MSEGLSHAGDGAPKDRASSSERHPARPFPAGVTCGACGETEGHRCSYEDMTGRQCVYWCERHSVFHTGRTWCQRHANSVRWLHAHDGTMYEIRLQAPIDDRSPNLVGSLVEDLNRPMTAGLTAVYARHQGVQIVTDGHVLSAAVPNGGGDQPGWERGWGVYSDFGHVARIVLRAAPSEPPVVYVFANGSLVLKRVPDWIANRGNSTDPVADRAKFRRDILAAVGPALPATGTEIETES